MNGVDEKLFLICIFKHDLIGICKYFPVKFQIVPLEIIVELYPI